MPTDGPRVSSRAALGLFRSAAPPKDPIRHTNVIGPVNDYLPRAALGRDIAGAVRRLLRQTVSH